MFSGGMWLMLMIQYVSKVDEMYLRCDVGKMDETCLKQDELVVTTDEMYLR